MKGLGPFLFQSPEDGAMGLIKGMMHPDADSGVLYGPAKSGMKGAAVPNPLKRNTKLIPRRSKCFGRQVNMQLEPSLRFSS